MKTVVFQFPSGFWGVKCKIGRDWFLWDAASPTKYCAIQQARYAAECIPQGRLYKKEV